MKDKAISLLKELTEAHSISGYEEEVRDIFFRELKDFGEMGSDRNGSIFCKMKGDQSKVLLTGHMDEIGFRVQNLTINGFIQFVTVGGLWS